MKLIEEYADKVIASGAYDPLDRVYVMNKIRGFVGDEDVEASGDQPLVAQLVDLAVKRGKIEDGQTAREILNDQLYDLMTHGRQLLTTSSGKSTSSHQQRQRTGSISCVLVMTMSRWPQLRRMWSLINQPSMVT